MKIHHDESTPTGVDPADRAHAFYQDEIAQGNMVGITIRTNGNEGNNTEIPVSWEVGTRVMVLVLDYVCEQLHIDQDKLAAFESRQALKAQKGGQPQ